MEINNPEYNIENKNLKLNEKTRNYSGVVKYGKMFQHKLVPFFPVNQPNIINKNPTPVIQSPQLIPFFENPVPVIKSEIKPVIQPEPIISYGLICFYKSKEIIKKTKKPAGLNNNVNDYDYHRTKKNDKDNTISEMRLSTYNKDNGHNNHNKYNKYNKSNLVSLNKTLPKIKILKRHESLSHTLKNLLSISGGISGIGCNNSGHELNEYDELESVLDVDNVEEIIDMDNEYDQNGNLNSNSVESVSEMESIYVNNVILVQRRITIGFVEFMRGKYDIDRPEYIIKLFNMMTFDEKRLLREYNSFDTLRMLIGLKKDNRTYHKIEYNNALTKYNTLLETGVLKDLLDRSFTKWTSPEWGLPKGRINFREFEIECAVREFVEETGIKYRHLNVYRNVKPLEEIYKGINGVVYKHIYYLASIKDNDPEAMKCAENIKSGNGNNNVNGNCEIRNVRMFNLGECHKIIRPYYISKMNVIKKGFQLINSMDHFFE